MRKEAHEVATKLLAELKAGKLRAINITAIRTEITRKYPPRSSDITDAQRELLESMVCREVVESTNL